MSEPVVLVAHHDGSELYAPQGLTTDDIFRTITVRVRVDDPDVTEVHLRWVQDGEPMWAPATRDDDTWWSAPLRVCAPITNYRFLLLSAAGFRWLNAAGLHEREVTDRHDYRLPAFAQGPADAVDAVVYQVFPDRFARATGAAPVADIAPDWAVPCEWDAEVHGTGPDTPLQFFGGDLTGVAEHLDHLVDLGVTCLYLTPIFPARSNHRYNATTFSEVDPLLGGNQALIDLVTAAHERGLTVMGDITTNHTGDDHEWFVAAREAAAGATERGHYYFNDDGSYLSWLGISSLPKLNYTSEDLRDKVYRDQESVLTHWLRPPFNLDGWRVDVANMTGRHGQQNDTLEVARQIRQSIEQARPGAVLVGEHAHDYTADLVGDGWQGTMNYAGFTRPVWSWLGGNTGTAGFMGHDPSGAIRRDAVAAVATMRDFAALVPFCLLQHSWTMLDSHDTPRFSELTGDAARTEVGLGLLFTLPGVPMVFAGAELGLGGSNGEDSRRPIPWDKPDTWDTERLATFRTLIGLRRSTRALRHGGLRWLHVEPDAMVFARESVDETILVAASRGDWAGCALPNRVLLPADPAGAQNLYGTAALTVADGQVHIPGSGTGVTIWRISR